MDSQWAEWLVGAREAWTVANSVSCSAAEKVSSMAERLVVKMASLWAAYWAASKAGE